MRASLLLALVWIVPALASLGCSQDEEDGAAADEPAIVVLTEENFRTLLTAEDVAKVMTGGVALNTRVLDLKKLAESSDPQQVVAIDSFYALVYETEDRNRSMTFAVTDFDSRDSAQDHPEKVKSGTTGLSMVDTPIGDVSTGAWVNTEGKGSIIVFIKGDKAVSLQTANPDGEQPLTDLDGLETLAKIVERKLL